MLPTNRSWRPERRRRISAAGSRQAPILQWVRSLPSDERSALLKKLVRMDVGLASAVPMRAVSPRVARMCLLLLCECASRRGLNAGELAVLFQITEMEALRALVLLLDGERRRPRSRTQTDSAAAGADVRFLSCTRTSGMGPKHPPNCGKE